MEKAGRIVASLAAEKRLHEVSLVVADEIHFLAEPGRGPQLEVLLSRIMSHCPCAQVVGMSATVPNIAEWLGAEFVVGEERPVRLAERVARPSELQELVKETTDSCGSVLVFCGTKRRTEDCARELCAGLKIPVAFHHAGLGADHREGLEGAFRARRLKVITATTTLATGVNLPARRVIVNTMMVGNKPLSAVQFKQMAGRAGRAGLDSSGDALLLAWPNKRAAAEGLLRPLSDPLRSLVLTEDSGDHLLRAILGYVCVKEGASSGDVDGYVQRSLLVGRQKPAEALGPSVRAGLATLVGYEMLLCCDDAVFSPTDIGWATFVSTLPVSMACGILGDLEQARSEGVVLVDQLHMLYLITPFDRLKDPDWGAFEAAFGRFADARVKIAERVGVTQQYVACRAHSCVGPREGPELHAARRLWAALMLQEPELVDESSVEDVARKYGYDRGGVEDLQSRAAAFGSMIAEFAENVGLGDLSALFGSLHGRVAFGAKRDVMVLCQIPRVGARRARALLSLGLKSVGDVATADPAEIAKRLKVSRALDPLTQGTVVSVVSAARVIMQQELAAVEASCGFGI